MSDARSRARDVDAWPALFLAVLGRRTRRGWAPLSHRGLLGPVERGSMQPVAAWLELAGHDRRRHFISRAAWGDSAAWTVLAHEADRLVGGPGTPGGAPGRGFTGTR